VQVEKYVPKRGKILDIGCGYGIFANFLALCSNKREILGVDMDEKKVQFAERHVHNTSFQVGDANRIRVRNVGGILLLDVLHHLHSYNDQEKLIRSCRLMLKRGGKLIIVEVNDKPMWKLVAARISDALLYPGQPLHYRYERKMLPLLRQYFGENHVVIHHLAYTPFPHLLYVCQKK